MIKYLTRKLAYGILVMAGVVVIVFFLFQGFGDPSRLVLGQTADKATQENNRKELTLDKPVAVQFANYLKDISPVSVHSSAEITEKQLKGIFIGDENKLAFKILYIRRVGESFIPWVNNSSL